MNPLVSIIIPNYNHAAFLKQRMETVLFQTYQHVEVIFLDDCSTDHSLAILSAYQQDPRLKQVILNPVNSGSTFQQWKKGVELAQGELIWIAESDDFSALNFLETAVNSLLQSPNAHLFFANSNRVNELGQVAGNFDNWLLQAHELDFTQNFDCKAEVFVKQALSKINVVMNASAVVFRKAAIGQFFTQYAHQFKYCGDWYFWAEIAKGGTVIYDATKLNYFRNHASTTRAAKPIAQQIDYYIEVLKVHLYIAKLYHGSVQKVYVQKTMDNLLSITPSKKLMNLLKQVYKKVPSLLPLLLRRLGLRAFKKIVG